MTGSSRDWSRLDGAERRAVAARIWTSWRTHGRRVGVILGFPGVGKTDHLAAALLQAAHEMGAPTALVELPQGPFADQRGVLVGALIEAFRASGAAALAEKLERTADVTAAFDVALREGALVVLDDVQHFFDPDTGALPDWLDKLFSRLAGHRSNAGFLLALSNRLIDADWLEHAEFGRLEAPWDEPDAATSILDGAMGSAASADRLGARRGEVIRRLGANPRALTLLGQLLDRYSLDDLLGAAPDPDAPLERDPELVQRLELRILNKAKAGLPEPATRLMRSLSVLRAPASAELVRELAADPVNWRAPRQALRDRHLLRIWRDRDHLHPLVREVELPRLRAEEDAWRDAHARAGRWYARALKGVGDAARLLNGPLAERLDAARHHLAAAGEAGELAELAREVGAALEMRFGGSAPRPATASERDARIELLSAFLAEPGPSGAEFHLATLLQERGLAGDLEQALVHAERATAGMNLADPWVLWIKLTREVKGLEAAVEVGRRAVRAVDAGKNLYTCYQQVGACLDHLGCTAEAVDALWEGFRTARGKNRVRLLEEALSFAAAAAEEAVLSDLVERIRKQPGVEPKLALGESLVHERRGEWAEAAAIAARGRVGQPAYIHLALHEAIGWLGAGRPEAAQAALDRGPIVWRHFPRDGATWLAALIALQAGRTGDAADLFSTYISEPAPTDPVALRAALLREWDERVATVGEPNPALAFPILPPAVTGLSYAAIRPQHGSPVLPDRVKTPTVAPPTASPGAPMASPPMIPPRLVKAQQERRLVPFVGAGLSLASDVAGNFPSWRAVPGRLLDECDDYSVWQDDAERAARRAVLIETTPAGDRPRPMSLDDLLAGLDEVKRKLGRHYPAAITSVFRPSAAARGAAHRAIMDLGATAVLTSNYDELLEMAEGPPTRTPYTWKQSADALADLKQGRKVLFKVHGTATDASSIVLTAGEYRTAHEDPAYRHVLEHLVASRSFLFVGFGLDDPYDLDVTLRDNATLLAQAAELHFALLKRSADPQDDVDLQARLRSSYNVATIFYDDHDQVVPFLEALAKV